MADVSDDVWLLGSLILASVTDTWWVALPWVLLASVITMKKLIVMWRRK